MIRPFAYSKGWIFYRIRMGAAFRCYHQNGCHLSLKLRTFDDKELIHQRRRLPPVSSHMRDVLSLLASAGVSGAHRIRRVMLASNGEHLGPISNGVCREEWTNIFQPAAAVAVGGQLEVELAVRFVAALALKRSDVFVDLGSSVGTLCVIAGLIARCHAVGVELSPSRHQQALRLASQLRSSLGPGNVEFVCGDINQPAHNPGLQRVLRTATVVFCAHQYLSVFDPCGSTSRSRFVNQLTALGYLQPGTKLISMAVLSPCLISSAFSDSAIGPKHGLKLVGAYDMERAYGLKRKYAFRLAMEYEVYIQSES